MSDNVSKGVGDVHEDAKAAGPASQSATHPLERIKHPGINDVMFGRGGDTNYHIGNHRFRVLADEHRESYRAASRQEKATVAQEVVRCWRAKTPPGRFLTKTNPEMGDDTLWHDVGPEAALKKASKILSEKAPPRSQKDDGKSRKRRAVDSMPDQPPAKDPNTRNHPLVAAPSVAAAVAASGVGAAFTGAAGISFHRPQGPLLQMAYLRAQQPPLNPQSLHTSNNLSPHLNVRDLYGLYDPRAWSSASQAAAAVALANNRSQRVGADSTRLAGLLVRQLASANREQNAAQTRQLLASSLLERDLRRAAEDRLANAQASLLQLLAPGQNLGNAPAANSEEQKN